MVVGLLVGELDKPGLEIGTFIKIPQFKEIISQVSIFGGDPATFHVYQGSSAGTCMLCDRVW